MKKDERIKGILQKLSNNRHHGSKTYYEPLPKDESKLIRNYYESLIDLPINGSDIRILNECDTVIGNGYKRIVVGDYGAYFEFDEEQIERGNIKQKWDGEPKYGIKYIWMITKDDAKTKVYWQKDTVDYADYKIGCFYMDILDAYV